MRSLITHITGRILPFNKPVITFVPSFRFGGFSRAFITSTTVGLINAEKLKNIVSLRGVKCSLLALPTNEGVASVRTIKRIVLETKEKIHFAADKNSIMPRALQITLSHNEIWKHRWQFKGLQERRKSVEKRQQKARHKQNEVTQ